MGDVVVLCDDTFRKMSSTFHSLFVMFEGSWCPVCKQAEVMLRDLVECVDMPVCSLNVDRCPHTASHYNILGTPTFILFREGAEVYRSTGSMSKDQILYNIKGVVS